MARGSVGVSTGTIIYTRERRAKRPLPPRKCDCRKCIHAIHRGDAVDCFITGDIAVHKSYCEFYKTKDEQEKPKKKYGKKSFKKHYKKKRYKKNAKR